MRECKICKIKQEVKDFPKAGVIKGKVYYRHKCKKCYWEQKSKRRKGIRELFLEYKKTQSCHKCGIKDYRVLDFHHEEDKIENLSNMSSRGWSIGSIIKEIKKCITLCANCHRILHYEENESVV